MVLPPLLVLMAVSSTTTHREFRFVPYGSAFSRQEEDNRPTISCDGRIPGGVTLELTHWTDNETPDSLYADTSTEMDLRFATQHDTLEDALILNNHYDTDGVLSVWACLEPSRALQHEKLLKEGAEAGDFGEWSSDSGIKLDCAIESFLKNDEEQAYHDVLQEIPNLLNDIEQTGGELYGDLWKDGFQRATKDWDSLKDGKALKRGPGKMVLVKEPGRHLSPYALHRGLVHAGLWAGTTRILRYLGCADGSFQYHYEMPGHGWVKKLADRPVIPSADKSHLVHGLPQGWASSGSLVGICHTTVPTKMSLEEIASLLHQLLGGCQ
jgi:hypothetical protein